MYQLRFRKTILNHFHNREYTRWKFGRMEFLLTNSSGTYIQYCCWSNRFIL